jgi:putative transposase
LALPRIVRPGRTYLVTRRCSERRFFLKPSPIVEQVYTYCLAVASERFDAEIHAFCVLSNHQHIVLTDPHGVLPRFMHWLDKSIAACLNAFYARFEPLWVPGSYSAVHLVDAEDIIDKTAYVLANPVEAGLVRQGVAWLGPISRPDDLRSGPEPRLYSAKRPGVYFSRNSKLPDHAELRLTLPSALEPIGEERAVRAIEKRREEKETFARAKWKGYGISFLGRRRIIGQSPFGSPNTREPRFQLSPNVACRDRWKRIEVLQQRSEFQAEYRHCFECFRGGDRSVVFPEGTWGPVVLYGARAKGWPRPRVA